MLLVLKRQNSWKTLINIDLHVVDSSEAGFGGGDVCGYWCWHCWWCRWWRRCVWRCWRAGGSVRGDWPGASRPPPPPPPPSPPPAAAQTVNDPEDWALQPPPASICSQAPRVSSPFTQKWEILLKMRCFLISVVWHFLGGNGLSGNIWWRQETLAGCLPNSTQTCQAAGQESHWHYVTFIRLSIILFISIIVIT